MKNGDAAEDYRKDSDEKWVTMHEQKETTAGMRYDEPTPSSAVWSSTP
jgi:hypothetical protein